MTAALLIALSIHMPSLPEYSAQKLDGLEFAFGLNDLGEVVGSPLDPKIKAGVIWRRGVLSLLTVQSGPEISIDDKVFRNRGGLKGSSFSPIGLNNVGTIVGYYHEPSIASYFTIPGAIYKGQTSSITQTLPPERNVDGNGTKLFAVNEKNVAVGSYRGPGYEQMPIIVNLEKGTMQVLSTEIEYYGGAIDINESGLVLGGGDGGL